MLRDVQPTTGNQPKSACGFSCGLVKRFFPITMEGVQLVGGAFLAGCMLGVPTSKFLLYALSEDISSHTRIHNSLHHILFVVVQRHVFQMNGCGGHSWSGDPPARSQGFSWCRAGVRPVC
jgi:hypothetical protein